MKKTYSAIGLALFMAMAHSNLTAAPFLIEGGIAVVDQDSGTDGVQFQIDSEKWTVSNFASVPDEWNAAMNGYSAGDGASGKYLFSGFYLGTFSGNADKISLNLLANYYLDSIPAINFDYYKDETGGVTTDPAAGDDSYWGTWTTEPADPDVYASFYVVKGGNGFALYYLDPVQNSGDWSSKHTINNGGQIAALSHFSILVDPSTPIPEPATMLLFGTGLIGLAGIARRKRS
jgi:hypothetical protein